MITEPQQTEKPSDPLKVKVTNIDDAPGTGCLPVIFLMAIAFLLCLIYIRLGNIQDVIQTIGTDLHRGTPTIIMRGER